MQQVPFTQAEINRIKEHALAGNPDSDIVTLLSREFGIKRSSTSVASHRRSMNIGPAFGKNSARQLCKGKRDAGADAKKRRLNADRDDLPGVDLMDLKGSHCRYAVHDHPYRFCGETAIDGSPYCAEHHKVCHDQSETARNKKRIGRLADRSRSIQ